MLQIRSFPAVRDHVKVLLSSTGSRAGKKRQNCCSWKLSFTSRNFALFCLAFVALLCLAFLPCFALLFGGVCLAFALLCLVFTEGSALLLPCFALFLRRGCLAFFWGLPCFALLFCLALPCFALLLPCFSEDTYKSTTPACGPTYNQ